MFELASRSHSSLFQRTKSGKAPSSKPKQSANGCSHTTHGQRRNEACSVAPRHGHPLQRPPTIQSRTRRSVQDVDVHFRSIHLFRHPLSTLLWLYSIIICSVAIISPSKPQGPARARFRLSRKAPPACTSDTCHELKTPREYRPAVHLRCGP